MFLLPGECLISELPTAGAVSVDRKQMNYTFVFWRVADNPGVDPSMITRAFIGPNPTDEPITSGSPTIQNTIAGLMRPVGQAFVVRHGIDSVIAGSEHAR